MLHLSNGETQKLLLARAVLRAPRLLVLDDPFAGLDAGSRAALRDALDDLAGTGMALVMATPRPEDLPSCVGRVLLIRDHRVAAELERGDLAAQLAASSLDQTEDRAAPVLPDRSAAAAAAGPRVPGEPLVELTDVTVRYGETTILDRVTFRVSRGEHWAISGPNGAGKSTLLSLVLADNPQAYANQVRLFGRQRGTRREHLGGEGPDRGGIAGAARPLPPGHARARRGVLRAGRDAGPATGRARRTSWRGRGPGWPGST